MVLLDEVEIRVVLALKVRWDALDKQVSQDCLERKGTLVQRDSPDRSVLLEPRALLGSQDGTEVLDCRD